MIETESDFKILSLAQSRIKWLRKMVLEDH